MSAHGKRIDWRAWLVAVSLVMLMGGVIWALLHYLQDSTYWPIREVQIKNELHNLDRDEIRMALLPALQGSFFSLDLERMRQAIIAVPWVNDAKIWRVWPDRLVIEVDEQEPVAHWGKNGLVNRKGEIFYPRKSWQGRLPVAFYGPDDSAAEMFKFFSEQQPLFKRRGLFIQELHLNPRGEWELVLQNHLRIMAGREKVAVRLQRLLAVYSQIRERTQGLEYVDLRYEQGFAVRAIREKTS